MENFANRHEKVHRNMPDFNRRPEKNREAFSTLTIWTVLNPATFHHNFGPACHLFLTRPAKFRQIPIYLLTPDLNYKYTKVEVKVLLAVQNRLILDLFVPFGEPVKLILRNVVLPTTGGDTLFDIRTYYQGELMDVNLDCCIPKDDDPNVAIQSFLEFKMP